MPLPKQDVTPYWSEWMHYILIDWNRNLTYTQVETGFITLFMPHNIKLVGAVSDSHY